MLKLYDNVNQCELFLVSLLFLLYFTFAVIHLNLSIAFFAQYLVIVIAISRLTFCLKKYRLSANLAFFNLWQIFCDLLSVICIKKMERRLYI